MNVKPFSRMLLLLVTTLCLMSAPLFAQSALTNISVEPPSIPEGTQWKISVLFNATLTAKVGSVFLINLDTHSVIPLDKNSLTLPGFGLTVLTLGKIDPVNNTYVFNIELLTTGPDGKTKSEFLSGRVVPLDLNVATGKVKEAKAKSAEDANIYVSGELNGAKGKKTTFATEISLNARETKVAKNTFITPIFFKLNASTDADADPDTMEFGIALRQRFLGTESFPAANFRTSLKIESERDFDNTNFIWDSRLTLLPNARPKGAQDKLKVFFRPFIGIEIGKNLRSPLASAEGGAIVRPLAGAKLRFNYPLNEDEEREINWETTYVRRWLLRNELGFKTNDDDELVLTKFGKSPRDFVESKFSYGVSKFFDFYIAYEWGQVPPSYKLVNHRFKLGFAFKKKYVVKQ